jgi:hypothetical protein
MLSTKPIDKIVFFEEDGKLAFAKTRHFYLWGIVSGVPLLVILFVLLFAPFSHLSLQELPGRYGEIGVIAILALFLYTSERMYRPWRNLMYLSSPVLFDFPSKRLNLKGERAVELCLAKAIVIQKDEKAIEAKYLILINHDSGVQTPIQFLAFDNWESAQTVANRIAKFLEVPVDIRKDKE